MDALEKNPASGARRGVMQEELAGGAENDDAVRELAAALLDAPKEMPAETRQRVEVELTDLIVEGSVLLADVNIDVLRVTKSKVKEDVVLRGIGRPGK